MHVAPPSDAEDSQVTTNYEAALAWADRGYNVVPRHPTEKRPGVRWKDLQTRHVMESELAKWRPMFANGVGFVTGEISGVIVIETDGLAGETVLDQFECEHGPLPETLVIRSGSRRGFHRHFRHPGHKVKTTANENIKVDIRGDGGFCVLPPSLHQSGGPYEIVRNAKPAELPRGLLGFIETKAREVEEAQGKPKGTVAADSSARHDQNFLGEAPEHLGECELGTNTAFNGPPPPVEAMRAALQHLAHRGAFKRRQEVVKDEAGRIVAAGWRECGMALKAAYGDEDGFDLWAETHIDEEARTDAPAQWASFASEPQPGHVTIGTIIKAAKDAGFTFTLAAQSASTVLSAAVGEQFTGHGADVWNGKKFAEMFRRKLLHVYETGEWLLFSPEQGWVAAPPGEAERAAKEVLGALGVEAAERWKANPLDPVVKGLMKHVERTSEAKNIRAMIDMAKSESGMTVQLSEFDIDPMLLGVANGVLDLRSGTLLSVSPEVLVSKRCNVAYDPNATCSRFDRFMLEVQPDADVRLFLQRLMGCCLTGRVDEHIFAFLYGHGANGKSVFVETAAWLLGDYARKIQTEVLMHQQRNSQGPSPDIVSLKGMRFVYANETEEGRHLAEARVKDLTGGDTLTGRAPYGKADITFRPTHKLIVVGNHKPEISDTSFGMWRRVALTPFDQTIPEANRDLHLLETLKGEGSGILNWMLAGLRAWRKDGLQIPEKITAATGAYRNEQDILGDWIDEDCMTAPGCSEKKGVLYADYRQWAERNGHKPLAQGRLTRRLNDRGCKLAADKRTVHGLSLTRFGMPGLARNV